MLKQKDYCPLVHTLEFSSFFKLIFWVGGALPPPWIQPSPGGGGGGGGGGPGR